MSQSNLSRRQFLKWGALSSSALALSACVVQPVRMPEDSEMNDAPDTEAEAGHSDEMMGDVEVMVGDVLDYTLDSDDWAGPYGSVTFQMHEAMHNGESAYFPVISMIPGDENYSSLFKVMPVEVSDSSLELDSEEAVMAAMESGDATVDEGQNLLVNHPLIKWAGGGLSVDPDLEGVLLYCDRL